jgi:hypothetical protein
VHAGNQSSSMELRVSILQRYASVQLSRSTLGDRKPQLSHSTELFRALQRQTTIGNLWLEVGRLSEI